MKQFKITKNPEVKNNKIIDIYTLHISHTAGGGTRYNEIAEAENLQILEDYAKIYFVWLRSDEIDYLVKEFDLKH